jgi:peptide/nickel transport system ATP-binding protein
LVTAGRSGDGADSDDSLDFELPPPPLAASRLLLTSPSAPPRLSIRTPKKGAPLASSATLSGLVVSAAVVTINLLVDLKAEFGLTYLFISHDLHVVRYLSDRVMVMYLGQVAELAPGEALFDSPRHPYTQALLSSMPTMDPDRRTEEAPLAGDPPTPVNPPPGCRFHPRCSQAESVCSRTVPTLTGDGAGRAVACLMHEAGSGHSRSVALARAA